MNLIQELASDPSYWEPTRNVADRFNLSYDQMSRVLRENKDPSLTRCKRKIGKTNYVNYKLFGLWMAGELSSEPVGAML